MRVCLPDPADTVPALATGVTFDAHLGIIARSWAAPEQ